MRCAHDDAPRGDSLIIPSRLSELPCLFAPLGSYSPRGTMTSQHPRAWPLVDTSPQPRPGASVLVKAWKNTSPLPSGRVMACWTSLLLKRLNGKLSAGG